jgi:organic hydroperoxide reductase OsmC/OhrA
MQDYPHHYHAVAAGEADGIIDTSSPGLATLPTLAPAEFGGPGDLWSPETMLVAAVANCFILTFRAVARGSHFDWNSASCKVVGVLDRVERVTCFTEFHIDVTLHLPPESEEHKAVHIAEKSEHVCLVTNSLTGRKILNVQVVIDDQTRVCVA